MPKVTLRKAKQLYTYMSADAPYINIDTFHNWLKDADFYNAMYNQALVKASLDLADMRIMRRYRQNLLDKRQWQKATGRLTRGTELKLAALEY